MPDQLDDINRQIALAVESKDSEKEATWRATLAKFLVLSAGANPSDATVFEARSQAKEALRIAKKHKHQIPEGLATSALGQIDNKVGDHSSATKHLQKAVEIFRKAGSQDLWASSLEGLAGLHLAQGNPNAAVDLLVEARVIYTRIGDHAKALNVDQAQQQIRQLTGATGNAGPVGCGCLLSSLVALLWFVLTRGPG